MKTKYFCTAEWHLKRYMGDHISLAALVYPFALRMTKKTGLFYCSGVQLAHYFDCSKDTIYKAIESLENLGFFILESAPPGKPKKYRVLWHSEWADKYPGRCTVKIKHDDWTECDSTEDDGYSNHGMNPTGAVGQSKQGASEYSSQGGA